MLVLMVNIYDKCAVSKTKNILNYVNLIDVAPILKLFILS